mmetsp:Transcript_78677/g.218492  ORF Transcript_78677/g.218492 Transcript_78677/m.218492 type:complete len:91 (-) Transcript_78677:70-342(-)
MAIRICDLAAKTCKAWRSILERKAAALAELEQDFLDASAVSSRVQWPSDETNLMRAQLYCHRMLEIAQTRNQYICPLMKASQVASQPIVT